MKNVTIALDDETYRQARIRAAEQGTSLSAMVKAFLQSEGASARQIHGESTGVREKPMVFNHAKPVEPLPPGAYGRFPDGTPYYTPDGKARRPGAMRGLLGWTDDFDSWPEGFLDSINHGWPGEVKWWLPDDGEPGNAPS